MSLSRALVVLAIVALVAAACTATPPAVSPLAPTEAPATPSLQPPTLPPNPTPTSAALPTPTPEASPSPTAAAVEPTDPPPTEPPAPTEPALTEPPGDGSATIEIARTRQAGEYLVGPTGMALYTFGRDGRNNSSCYERCAAAWPPLTVEDGEQPTVADGVDGTVGVFEREDGRLQVALDNRPLYYFDGDQEPGDTNGDGADGLWFLARP